MRTNQSLKQRLRYILHLERALRLVWESSRGYTITSGLFLIIQGMLPLLSLYLVKLIVDGVTAALKAPGEGVNFGDVLLLIGLASIVALASAFARSISNLVSEAQARVVTDHVQDILHAKSIEVDLEYYENAKYQDTLHRAQLQAPDKPIRIVNALLRIGHGGITLLAIAGLLLFTLHWVFAVILFAAAIPGALVRLWYADNMYRWQRRRTSTERRVRYFNWLLTGDWHAKEVRLFDLGPLFMHRSKNLREQLREEQLHIAKRRSVGELVAQLGQIVALFGSFAFVAHQTMLGSITLGDLVMYYQAFQRGQALLQETMGGITSLYENNLFLSYLYEFLDLKPRIAEPLNPKALPRPMKSGIVLEHMTFQYPGGTRPVLNDITLTIRAGEHVAFVGENGAGKTTLVKLLCRLYDPTQGRITFDGVDLWEFESAALRREISVVFQDYARYQMTAEENIWMGNTLVPPERAIIEAAARGSGAHEVISGLPQGYDTVLGKRFEDGVELSIGEWQKVAIARAFLRPGQVIVFDEPTSALDAKAEYEVFKRFHRLAKGRTTILISHRLSTTKMADRIFVLKDGSIAESGTHQELVENRGTYAQLFEMQAQHYR